MQQVFQGDRFPNVVVATDGTVLAFWNGVKVRRSEDGGKTWGAEILVGKGFMGGGVTVDETSGDILAFVETKHTPQASLTVYRSTDHGKTWRAQETVIHPNKDGNVPTMHMNEHGITLRHGQHKGRLLRPTRWYDGSNDAVVLPETLHRCHLQRRRRQDVADQRSVPGHGHRRGDGGRAVRRTDLLQLSQALGPSG